MKKKVLAILTAVMLLCVLCVATVNVFSKAKAEEPASYKIVLGTSLRIESGELDDGSSITNGMRFGLLINESAYNEIQNGDTTLYFIIAPQSVFDYAKEHKKDLYEYVGEVNPNAIIEISQNNGNISKIKDEDGNIEYWVYGVLCNVKDGNLSRAYNVKAFKEIDDVRYNVDTVTPDGTPVSESDADSGARSLYQTVNNVLLNGTEEDTEKLLNLFSSSEATMSYKYWFGKENYPIQVETADQYDKLAEIVNAGSLSTVENLSIEATKEAIEESKVEIEDNTITVAEKTYTVKFLDEDGEELKTQQLKEGEMPEAPAHSELAGYTFSWDKDVVAVGSENVTYTERKTALEYTVILHRGSGDESVKFTVENKAEILESIKLPVDTAEYTYSWTPALPEEFDLQDYEFTEVATKNNIL